MAMSAMKQGAWLLGGLAVLVALRYAIPEGEAQQVRETTAAAPVQQQTFKVEGFECYTERGWLKGKVTIRNNGPGSVRFAELYVASGGRRVNVFFSPLTIPEGSLAAASWMENGVSDAGCEISAIQDRNGHPIRLTR